MDTIIGVGIFLLCIGGMIYLLSKANEVNKKAEQKGARNRRR